MEVVLNFHFFDILTVTILEGTIESKTSEEATVTKWLELGETVMALLKICSKI